MHIVRFILPFLFARNWYNGSWELSRARCILFFGVVAFVLLGIGIMYFLQAPIIYSPTTL